MRAIIFILSLLLSLPAAAQTLVYRDGKEWRPFTEPRAFVRADNGEKEELWPDAVRKALASRAWTEKDLAIYGLAVAEPMMVPEGKQAVGDPIYVEKDGKVVEQRALEDIPPPPPPPVETVEDKLAKIGLTLDELREALQ
jgi:hypothetical protein